MGVTYRGVLVTGLNRKIAEIWTNIKPIIEFWRMQTHSERVEEEVGQIK